MIANKTIAPGKILAIFSNSLFEDIRALTIDPATKIFYFIKNTLIYSLDSSGNPVIVAGGGSVLSRMAPARDASGTPALD